MNLWQGFPLGIFNVANLPVLAKLMLAQAKIGQVAPFLD